MLFGLFMLWLMFAALFSFFGMVYALDISGNIKSDEHAAIAIVAVLFWPITVVGFIGYFIYHFCMIFVRLYQKYIQDKIDTME